MTIRGPLVVLLVLAGEVVSLEARVDKNIVYGMHSGLALLMDVHYPEKPNGYGVIFIGGTGWHMPLAYDAPALKDRAGSTRYVQRLLEAGYTVFGVNHRAAPRFRYPAAVEDARRAVRFIRHNAKEYGVNAERIGAVGVSSGGHLVHLLGAMDGTGQADDRDPVNRQSSRVQCLVAVAAPWELLKIRTEAGLQAVTSFVGTPPRQASPGTVEHKTYMDASPVTYVSADDAPVLLIHGDADATVPFEQSQSAEAALRETGVQVKLVGVPGGNHGLDREGTADPPDVFGEMVAWLDRHLKVAADSR